MCDPKYDTAFAPTLMSDDEDALDEAGKKLKHFISRPLEYCSEEVFLVWRRISD